MEQKSTIEYEKDEIRADIAVFPPEALPAIEKFLNDESLDSREAEVLRAARGAWWEEKYGFPHGSKSARREVLARKYAPPEEVVKAQELQERMFKALGEGASSEETRTLKEEYLQRYPDQLEGIELLFGMKPFLELSRKLDDASIEIKSAKERRNMYQDLTESHFLLTHFVISNGRDKEFLALFWASLEKMAGRSGLSRELNIIRRGTVTQVATMRIFKELGMEPKLSHPRDDAFNSIDLWSDASHAVQVKSTQAEIPEIVETEEIAFPGTEIRNEGGTSHFTSQLFHDAQRFRAKVDRYREITHNPGLRGFFIVVPYSKVDFVTGEPDKDLVEMVRQKLDTKR